MSVATQTRYYFDLAFLDSRKRCRTIARRFFVMVNIHNERREMRKMSDQMLEDIGISREELVRECNRKFRDIPDNRLP